MNLEIANRTGKVQVEEEIKKNSTSGECEISKGNGEILDET